MSEKLTEVTVRLGENYVGMKEHEKEKDKAKKEFFEIATQTTNSLAEKLVETGPRGRGMSEEDARKLITTTHPRWEIVDIRVVTDGWEAILRENPAYKKFSFVNPVDSRVYERQIQVGAPTLDDERLKDEDPDLYERVTYVPEPERKLRPLDELNEDDLAELGDYIYEGKPVTKLAAPRKAKPEELEEAQ